MSKNPGWLNALMIGMGACTPGGFLLLIALLSSANLNLTPLVWCALVVAGGFGGWRLSKAVALTPRARSRGAPRPR